jgi:predicted membrane channel-forming protein YqfA (hemolysin III family)
MSVLPKIALVFVTLCRQRLATRMYSNSIIGVGVASTLYHTSRGESRRFFRFCDYSMIATTTMVRVPPVLFVPAEKMKKPSATNITRMPSFIPCIALLKTWRFFWVLGYLKKIKIT